MTVLLDLGGQCAAAGFAVIRANQADQLVERRTRETVPLNRRVAIGTVGGKQFAVLDEQQAIDKQLRHFLKTGIDAFGEA